MGHTSDITKRLKAHNNGEVISSKRFRPYELLMCRQCQTLKDAKQKEKSYKNFRGRQKIKKIIEGRQH